ncbi:hypothetical protein SeLEV6574_g06177 [Synchytrium endobioticum]|uniref:Uncharacterized protein n=1 Tax=Synchytrium endobioticum TaxID=286115 RepID=A0A507CQ65_9FUNG|nr:hypothetical protein SeLEV6574_g06177 [Synchytrium endobioticum]
MAFAESQLLYRIFSEKISSGVAIIPAASIIVCSPIQGDAKGFRVLMLKRNNRGPFGGLMVFPGGALDPADHSPEWLTILDNPISKALAFKVAAIREAFEECGLNVFKPDLKLPVNEIAQWRKSVHDDGTKLLEMAKTTGCVPDLNRLGLYSNWITPAVESKRFDTWFYVYVSPKAVSSLRLHADEGTLKNCQHLDINTIISTYRNSVNLSRVFNPPIESLDSS